MKKGESINRIIIIGNGFDLAHGLKTSYRDFIIDYWEKMKKEMEGIKGAMRKDSVAD